MSAPRVSVTMTVRNVELFLAESIESVLGQTFTDFEFIIVDFGSTDNSKGIIREYSEKDERIKFYETPGLTLVEARNAAFAHAVGDLIAVMDADDICLPDRLLWEVEFLDRNPEVGLVGGSSEWVNARGASLGIHDVPCNDEEIRLALLTYCPFWHATLLVRHRALAAVEGYRNVFVYSHDYDMELRIADRFKVENLGKVVLKYRIHPNQVSLMRVREQSLCKLAAQVSAEARRNHRDDPFDKVDRIVPSTLAALGVSEEMQEERYINEFRIWIRNIDQAGELSSVTNFIVEALRSGKVKYAQKWEVADLWLTAGSQYWKRNKCWSALYALMNAVYVSPRVIIGRPFRFLMRRLRLSS